MLALVAVALAADVAAPTVPDGFVVRPSFSIGDQTTEAGLAFAISEKDTVLLLTAHQLLGPNGGRAVQLTPQQLVASLRSVVGRDAWTGRAVVRAEKALLVADARPYSDVAAVDVAAFRVRSLSPLEQTQLGVGAPTPGALAAAAPAVGDPVWLAAPVKGDASGARTHVAKVGALDGNALFYEFPAAVDLTGTVGAPVLDAAGKVVGIHVGGGVLQDGTSFGAAAPLSAVRDRVGKALATP